MLPGIAGCIGGLTGIGELAISGTPVLTATEGTAYAGFSVSASGGTPPYTYSLVGTWPAGISINSSTGAVSGTPTESGSFTGLSVRVTDDASDTADLPTFTIEVSAAGATDPNFSSVVLGVSFDGADGSTASTDWSPVGRTLTFVDNAQIDTAQFKFGGASLLLDGTDDKVTAPDSSDWIFPGEFTIEGWVRFPTLVNSTRYTIVSQYGVSGNQSWRLAVVTGAGTRTLNFGFSTSGTGFAHNVSSSNISASLTSDVWHHIAVDRDASGKIRVYLDGVMVASKTSATGTNFDSTATLEIGAEADTSLNKFIGHIDEVRITKGVARYASDAGVTVPTEAFPRS